MDFFQPAVIKHGLLDKPRWLRYSSMTFPATNFKAGHFSWISQPFLRTRGSQGGPAISSGHWCHLSCFVYLGYVFHAQQTLTCLLFLLLHCLIWNKVKIAKEAVRDWIYVILKILRLQNATLHGAKTVKAGPKSCSSSKNMTTAQNKF